MKIINRKMHAMKTRKGRFDRTQASSNSGGRITLGNYNSGDKDTDEIIILSDTETLGARDEDTDFLPF